MTAIVIPFPGVDPATIRPRPTCVQDLPPGAKALVVVQHELHFRIVLRPAHTKRERDAWLPFPSVRAALVFARRLAAQQPAVFQLVIDDTPRSLDRILGPGPDPMDLGGAA